VPCLETKILRHLMDHAPQDRFSINGLNDHLNIPSTHLITGTKYLNIGRKAHSLCVFLELLKGVSPTEKPSSPRKTSWWLTGCAGSSPVCFALKKREGLVFSLLSREIKRNNMILNRSGNLFMIFKYKAFTFKRSAASVKTYFHTKRV
jgi:hypothetical protein